MKNALKILAIILLGVLVVSCKFIKKGKKSHEQTLTPYTVAVSGDLADCYKVVDREYKVTENSAFKILTVELERTNAPLPFDINSYDIVSYSVTQYSPNVQVGFGIEFRDKDGSVLDKVAATGSGFSGSYSGDDPVELAKLRPGETGSIRFSVNGASESATQFKISSAFNVNGGSAPASSSGSTAVLVTGTNVRLRIGPGLNFDPLTDAQGKNIHPEKGDKLEYLGEANDFYKVRYNGKEVYISKQFSELIQGSATTTGSGSSVQNDSSSSDWSWDDDDDDDDDDDVSSSRSSSSKGSAKVDELLDSYEAMVDEYVAMLKKGKNGDVAAIASYAKYLKKVQEMQSKLEKLKDDDEFSEAQIQRLVKITSKMATGVL